MTNNRILVAALLLLVASSSAHARWTCDATCNVQQIEKDAQCPERVYGHGEGADEALACHAAQKDANRHVRGDATNGTAIASARSEKPMSAKPLVIRRVAATFDFDPIPMHQGPSLVFRLDVVEELPSTGRYAARMFRREFLRVQPSFALREGQPPSSADEIVLVEDVQDFWSITGSSVADVLALVVAEMRRRFGVA